MAELIIYGASDDLIEIEGVVSDEINAEQAHFLVVTGEGARAAIGVEYNGDGCWEVAYGPDGEDVPAPPGRLSVDRYTARLVLDVDERTTIKRVQPSSGQ